MNIVAGASLRELNTLHLASRAQWLATVDSVDELVGLVRDSRFAGLPRRVLGGGSNIVLAGDEVGGLVIRLAFHGWRVLSRKGTSLCVEADAGLAWHELVRACVDADYGGIENLALIPGSVGAAPVQNIGAYGVELAQVFESLDAVNLRTGESRCFTRAECAFGYRESVFKHAAGDWAITRVRLRLDSAAPLALDYRDLQEEWGARGNPVPGRRLVFDMVCAIRRRKLPDPALIGNVGSFFKNPVVSRDRFDELRRQLPEIVGYPQADGSTKLAAGWLIDHAGWKGRREGAVGVHERQALVLVNHGGATGGEILALARHIVASVEAVYGVTLEREPVVW